MTNFLSSFLKKFPLLQKAQKIPEIMELNVEKYQDWFTPVSRLLQR
jgi:hypothetical protein